MKFKKVLLNSVFILLIAYFQSVVSVFDVHPDFILIYVITYSLLYGDFYGEIVGFGSGLLEDIMSGGIMGINAFAKTLAAYLTKHYQKVLMPAGFHTFVLIILISTVVKWISFYVVGSRIFGFVLPDVSFLKLVLEVILNAAFSFPFFVYFSKRKFYQMEE